MNKETGQKMLLGLNVLLALTELSEHLAAEIGETANTIRAAQAAGRDLTDAELAQIQKARTAAVNAWQQRHG